MWAGIGALLRGPPTDTTPRGARCLTWPFLTPPPRHLEKTIRGTPDPRETAHSISSLLLSIFQSTRILALLSSLLHTCVWIWINSRFVLIIQKLFSPRNCVEDRSDLENNLGNLIQKYPYLPTFHVYSYSCQMTAANKHLYLNIIERDFS